MATKHFFPFDLSPIFHACINQRDYNINYYPLITMNFNGSSLNLFLHNTLDLTYTYVHHFTITCLNLFFLIVYKDHCCFQQVSPSTHKSRLIILVHIPLYYYCFHIICFFRFVFFTEYFSFIGRPSFALLQVRVQTLLECLVCCCTKLFL